MALAISGRAYAGFECDRESSIQAVEAAARSKAKLEEARGSSSFMCAGWGTEAEKARVLAACRKILDRDGDTSPCVDLVAVYGVMKLGGHDIFTLVSKEVGKPLEYDGSFWFKQTELLAKLGDPRGAAVIIEIWKTTLPLADEREKRHRSMSSWSSWRQGAAAALGTLGSTDDIAFLEEQAKATRDSYVSDACREAIKAINKRTKSAPSAPAAKSAPDAAQRGNSIFPLIFGADPGRVGCGGEGFARGCRARCRASSALATRYGRAQARVEQVLEKARWCPVCRTSALRQRQAPPV